MDWPQYKHDRQVLVRRTHSKCLIQQGMLYYHLLLARLEARGEIGRASVPDSSSRRASARRSRA